MFFNKGKENNNYIKASTPEARRRQRFAIASYYAKKNSDTQKSPTKTKQEK